MLKFDNVLDDLQKTFDNILDDLQQTSNTKWWYKK